MPVTNGKRAAGLVVLSVGNALAVWSATNTSYVGHRAFGLKDPKVARFSMNLGMGLILATSTGLLALYGRDALPAAIGSVATGTLLYAIYDRPLRSGAAALGLL